MLDEKPKRKNDELQSYWQRRGLPGITINILLGLMLGVTLFVVLSALVGCAALHLFLSFPPVG
jgi:hypothetical protein